MGGIRNRKSTNHFDRLYPSLSGAKSGNSGKNRAPKYSDSHDRKRVGVAGKKVTHKEELEGKRRTTKTMAEGETYYDFSKRLAVEAAEEMRVLQEEQTRSDPASIQARKRQKRKEHDRAKKEKKRERMSQRSSDRAEGDGFGGLKDHVRFGDVVQAPPKLKQGPKRESKPEILSDVQLAVRDLYKLKKKRASYASKDKE